MHAGQWPDLSLGRSALRLCNLPLSAWIRFSPSWTKIFKFSNTAGHDCLSSKSVPPARAVCELGSQRNDGDTHPCQWELCLPAGQPRVSGPAPPRGRRMAVAGVRQLERIQPRRTVFAGHGALRSMWVNVHRCPSVATVGGRCR